MSDRSLDSLISTDLILLDQEFENKIDAIETVLDLIDSNDKVKDREEALEALKQREKEATTGVGKGIGIPHAKTEAVEDPVVGFAQAKEGVDFGAADGKDAELIFMLLFPEGSEDEYMDMLSSISRSLMHEEVREALLEADEKSQVMDILEQEVAE